MIESLPSGHTPVVTRMPFPGETNRRHKGRERGPLTTPWTCLIGALSANPSTCKESRMPNPVKSAVVYSGIYGTNNQMAEFSAETACARAEVRLPNVPMTIP